VFPAGTVTDEQLQAIWSACSEASHEPAPAGACRRLSQRLSDILGAPAPVFSREVSPWKLIEGSVSDPSRWTSVAAPKFDNLCPSATERYHVLHAEDGTRWTPVPLDEGLHSQTLLLLPGDWNAGAARTWLPRLAQTASMALRLSAARYVARTHAGIAASAYGFARRLGQLHGERELHQFIVDATARAVNARLGGLSVYRPTEAAITVAATYGYSSESVGHVRITPGTGIIGGVFASKKPLLVRDAARVPGLTPRSQRYQTASFMALPVVAGSEALGVVTLADRADGRPFNREDLAAVRILTVVSGIGLVREQLAKQTNELAHAAAVDALTGMFNRRYLETRLDAEMDRSRRTSTPLSLLMLDIDVFKAVNDKLGHQQGDAVLRKVAEIVRRSVRSSDVCARYGGDEFAIIVPEHAASQTQSGVALQTAERIRTRVEAFRWDALGLPQNLAVTVSIGVAIAEVGERADTLIGRADERLYAAKTAGRNRVAPGATV
jgi:diguanylate cyclase (GGDEF)-like protein